jgi:hypothetical protein
MCGADQIGSVEVGVGLETANCTIIYHLLGKWRVVLPRQETGEPST